MQDPLYKKYFLILILCCLAGCASSPVKGGIPGAPAGTERPSSDSMYHYSLGVLHILDDNIDGAIKEYQKAMNFDPQSSYIKTELISLYIERGEIQKAIVLSKKYLTEHPNNVNGHLLLGGLYLNRKDYKNAVAEYEKVIELDPANTFSRIYLGTIYAETKDYKKALKTFRDLIKTS
ncbi:MAG: tetratricopeptide repeat protein, partial [Syntrophales bacterium]